MRLGLTLLYVEDFPRMLAFYRDALGLQVTDADPGPGYVPGVDWAQLRTDGGEIELFERRVHGGRRKLPLPRRNASVITFRVEGIDEHVERLRAAGADIPRISRQPWGAAAHFHDPEGNELQLYEPS